MQITLKQSTFDDGFTQSEIGTWDECAFKWYLAYNERLHRRGSYAWYFIVGDAWHQTTEQMYKSKGKHWTVPKLALPQDAILKQDDEGKLEYWQEIVEAMAEAYAEFFAKDFKVFEIESTEELIDVQVEFEGTKIRLQGKIDMRGKFGKPRMAIMDHKTSGLLTPALSEGWDFKFQFMFYLWLEKIAKGKDAAKEFVVNAVKKTQLRKKDGEHIITFAARVKQDMLKRPEMYFYRQYLDLTQSSMVNFEKEVLAPKLRRIAILQGNTGKGLLTDILAGNKNTEACHSKFGGVCQFFPICHHGYELEKFQYETHADKHLELVSDE